MHHPNLIYFVTLTFQGLEQCCSKLKISGDGSGKKQFESALQQYEYSGTSFGKPRYRRKSEGKTCDLMTAEESYLNRYNKYTTNTDSNSISYRFDKDNMRQFWKVISLRYGKGIS